MTITFATESLSFPDRLSGALAELFRQISAHRAKRMQRLALASLLELGTARLDDLGLNHQDVTAALRSPAAPAAENAGLRRCWQ
jgi:uncharacterized protein YjiS (DUF1127 family)